MRNAFHGDADYTCPSRQANVHEKSEVGTFLLSISQLPAPLHSPSGRGVITWKKAGGAICYAKISAQNPEEHAI